MLAGRQEKLRNEDKTLILVNEKLVIKSNMVPVSSSATRHEKNANSSHRHLLGFTMETECKITSWVKKEVSELETFSAESIRLWTGCAEVVRSHDIPLSTEIMIKPLSLFSIASRGSYLIPSVKGIEIELKLLCQCP